jgi:DNA primase
LLLKEPNLAHLLPDTQFLQDLKEPGIDLLLEIVEIIQHNSQMNDGILFERYRDTETGRILSRLRQWQPVISSDLFEAEFLDVMEQLKQKTTKQLFDHEKLLKWKELSKEERENYIMQAKTNNREQKPTQ